MSRTTFRAVLLGVLASVIVFELLAVAHGQAPLALAQLLFEGTWGNSYGIGQVLFKATPLLLVALGVDLALRAGLFNVGAEGQLAVGSFVAAVVGTKVASLPQALAIPSVLLAAALAGALLALGPAYLRVRFGAHEVISTIMSNNIVSGVLSFLLASGFALQGTVRTQDVAASARLPRLDAIGLTAFRGSAASASLFIAVALAIGVWWAVPRLRALKEISLVGQNDRAAAFVGINVARRRLLAFAASGALCALAASATVLGYKGYYEEGLGAGAGFAGLGVALLGKGRIWGLALSALLFATLEQGGLALNAVVPKEAMDVLSALIVLIAALTGARAQVLFDVPRAGMEPQA